MRADVGNVPCERDVPHGRSRRPRRRGRSGRPRDRRRRVARRGCLGDAGCTARQHQYSRPSWSRKSLPPQSPVTNVSHNKRRHTLEEERHEQGHAADSFVRCRRSCRVSIAGTPGRRRRVQSQVRQRPAGRPSINKRASEACDAIRAAATKGRLDIKLFPNSQLGGESDLLSQVRSGAVQIFTIGGLVVSTVVPVAAINGTAFAFKDYEQGLARHGRQARRPYPPAPRHQASYTTPATMWDLGFRQITNSSRPIGKVEDLRRPQDPRAGGPPLPTPSRRSAPPQ